MTFAQRFIAKAQELVPFADELQDLDPSIDDQLVIDEIISGKSEYLGGMAVVIRSIITLETSV